MLKTASLLDWSGRHHDWSGWHLNWSGRHWPALAYASQEAEDSQQHRNTQCTCKQILVLIRSIKTINNFVTMRINPTHNHPSHYF